MRSNVLLSKLYKCSQKIYKFNVYLPEVSCRLVSRSFAPNNVHVAQQTNINGTWSIRVLIGDVFFIYLKNALKMKIVASKDDHLVMECFS